MVMSQEHTQARGTLLVTGFEPFDERGYNTSSAVLAVLPDRIGELRIVTTELPVDWVSVGPIIEDVLTEHRPEAAVGLGMSRTGYLAIEQTAANLCARDRPDNAGKLAASKKIRLDGPASYPTDLPALEIQRALEKAGMPAKLSDSAGSYLCNLAFYSLVDCRHRLGLAIRAGFLHVPPLETDGGWPLERLAEGLVLALAQVWRAIVAGEGRT